MPLIAHLHCYYSPPLAIVWRISGAYEPSLGEACLGVYWDVSAREGLNKAPVRMGVVATNFCCVFPTLNDVDVNESCKDRNAWERNDILDTLTNLSLIHI